jgi:hypothetical protein
MGWKFYFAKGRIVRLNYSRIISMRVGNSAYSDGLFSAAGGGGVGLLVPVDEGGAVAVHHS